MRLRLLLANNYMGEVVTNPNGANGTTSDPREQVCWDFYVKGLIVGHVNAQEAALNAGYSGDHARNITLQGWFKERLDNLRRKGMVSKSERNLEKILDTDWELKGDKETETMRIVGDVSFKVAKTLGKDLGYTERDEHSGPGGKDLPGVIVISYADHTSSRLQSEAIPTSVAPSDG